MLGQAVNADSLSLADGWYLLADEAQSGNCGELREGFMIVGGNRITGCAGNLIENHLPNLVIVDNAWKPFLRYSQVAMVVILVVLIIKTVK